jgi:hypothetical protein
MAPFAEAFLRLATGVTLALCRLALLKKNPSSESFSG